MLSCVSMRAATALLAGLLSTVSLASTARADGMSVDPAGEPAVQSGYIWNGLYVAAGIGVGRFDHNVSVNTSAPPDSHV